MSRLVRSPDEAPGGDSNEVRKLYAETVLKAVADRITEGVDIAERTDVTGRQVLDPLRLLQHVHCWENWPIEFSRFEIAVISRGIRQSMLDEPMSPASLRPGRFPNLTFAGISGTA